MPRKCLQGHVCKAFTCAKSKWTLATSDCIQFSENCNGVFQVDDMAVFDLGAKAAHAKQKDAMKELKRMRVSNGGEQTRVIGRGGAGWEGGADVGTGEEGADTGSVGCRNPCPPSLIRRLQL